MIPRDLTNSLKMMAGVYPIVTLIGPRQSGKTTLARESFPGYTYVNLERLETRRFAKEDPKGFFESYPPPLVIDEVQNCPELLSEIQVLSDSLKKNGNFILTGSQQLSLMQGVTQSLAGRTALLTLLPLSLRELAQAGVRKSRDESILWGGMPRIYDSGIEPGVYYRDYFRTYVERDVRSLMKIKDFDKFEIFVKLLAGRIGQVFNASALAGDVGVSSKTIGEWVALLETSNIIFKLRPWFGNLGKRLVKSPKIYFTDVGLAAMLLGIENTQQLSRDPLLGNLFENLVVLEVMKSAFNENRMIEFFYFRTDTGVEVDLLFKVENRWTAVEIKSASSVNSDYFKNMDKLAKLPGFESLDKNLVYSGENLKNFKGVRCCNFETAGSLLLR
ncbi:MAG: ATP-binding protein [Fibrobacter sp.]|nr:ATP-binding protein [Fibrobacter sp.]